MYKYYYQYIFDYNNRFFLLEARLRLLGVFGASCVLVGVVVAVFVNDFLLGRFCRDDDEDRGDEDDCFICCVTTNFTSFALQPLFKAHNFSAAALRTLRSETFSSFRTPSFSLSTVSRIPVKTRRNSRKLSFPRVLKTSPRTFSGATRSSVSWRMRSTCSRSVWSTN